MSNVKLIYVADGEERIRNLICSYLENSGFKVKTFTDGSAVLAAFVVEPADMLILDIMMPGLDGYSVCREIRKTSQVPVIMVSAKEEEIDRILGLELGSDDYMSKPFSPIELVARVKNIFKRTNPLDYLIATPYKPMCKDIELFPEERRVLCCGKDLELASKEFDLLLFLISNKNHAFTREQLIEKIWGYDYMGETRTIDDLVKRIRKKLTEADSEIKISTVWGFGYKVTD